MGKEIKKRDGFFKSMKKYSNNKLFNERQNDLEKENINLDKNDKWALLWSSFLVIFLPCILVLGIMILLGFLVFGVI